MLSFDKPALPEASDYRIDTQKKFQEILLAGHIKEKDLNMKKRKLNSTCILVNYKELQVFKL